MVEGKWKSVNAKNAWITEHVCKQVNGRLVTDNKGINICLLSSRHK